MFKLYIVFRRDDYSDYSIEKIFRKAATAQDYQDRRTAETDPGVSTFYIETHEVDLGPD